MMIHMDVIGTCGGEDLVACGGVLVGVTVSRSWGVGLDRTYQNHSSHLPEPFPSVSRTLSTLF